MQITRRKISIKFQKNFTQEKFIKNNIVLLIEMGSLTFIFKMNIMTCIFFTFQRDLMYTPEEIMYVNNIKLNYIIV